MKSLSILMTLASLLIANGWAQMSQPMVGEDTIKISDHVWAIMGFPNIAIIAGSRSTLVVDTGLGPKNGATAARVAAKLAPNNAKLFLTTTHFHPEHAAGEPGFPAGHHPHPRRSAAAGNGEAWAGDGRHVQQPVGAE